MCLIQNYRKTCIKLMLILYILYTYYMYMCMKYMYKFINKRHYFLLNKSASLYWTNISDKIKDFRFILIETLMFEVCKQMYIWIIVIFPISCYQDRAKILRERPVSMLGYLSMCQLVGWTCCVGQAWGQWFWGTRLLRQGMLILWWQGDKKIWAWQVHYDLYVDSFFF